MGIRGYSGQLFGKVIPLGDEMHIHEIFWSVQGEGLRSGHPSIFVRTTGCTLQCPYCDTRDSWVTGTKMKVEQIILEIEKYKEMYPQCQVVLTGGEPLEQDLSEMVSRLKQKKFFLSIETNGIYFQSLDIDWWTVSPKDIADFYIAADLHEKIDEVKCIVNQNLTLDVLERIRAIRTDFPIFLQPDFFNPNKYQDTLELYEQCQKVAIPGVRLGIQLQHILDIR
ncbi:MAG: 7-carboxy-7-deazaguanine synthase QueE [Candidatus Aminicenantes bacterium]|nr:7-carboxy-7-deazaguanine synthase QueE [Candidatus Aminicenantes bacterium]